MNQRVSCSNTRQYKVSLAVLMLFATVSAQAIPTINNTDDNDPLALAIGQDTIDAQQNNSSALNISGTLAAQLQPSKQALSDANQELLSRNAQLQRQVNDLQTQVNVLVYESKGQLFLYGAFTVLISLLVGIFISWLVFTRRDRW